MCVRGNLGLELHGVRTAEVQWGTRTEDVGDDVIKMKDRIVSDR